MRRTFFEDELPEEALGEVELTIDLMSAWLNNCKGICIHLRNTANRLLYELLIRHISTPGRVISETVIEEDIMGIRRSKNRQNRTAEIRSALKYTDPDSLKITRVNNGIISGLRVDQNKPIRIISPRATNDYSHTPPRKRATILFPPLKWR